MLPLLYFQLWRLWQRFLCPHWQGPQLLLKKLHHVEIVAEGVTPVVMVHVSPHVLVPALDLVRTVVKADVHLHAEDVAHRAKAHAIILV